MIYRFSITSQEPKPPHRHYRTGTLKAVLLNGNVLPIERKGPLIVEILENFDLFEGIKIETKYYRHNYEPYPDFLTIDISLDGINLAAKQFLDQQEVKYQIKPIEIINDQELTYSLIMFPTKDLIDIEASNGHINEKGKLATNGKKYFDGKLVLKNEAKNIKGIFRLDKLGNILICDEETKKALENSSLIGIRFELLTLSEK